ncbi:hypothetical protein PROFUN_07249 [Planoprotostelium fungivorum]|uniref:Transmembrane protein n=1 Tax=Planoprotostelium fungivorum TaxID=1890364 RepID=A0A2P6NM70_9EUKA|nr:hypothetical protein PROFUN_07249 [Planoprotostelium fungivorum]
MHPQERFAELKTDQRRVNNNFATGCCGICLLFLVFTFFGASVFTIYISKVLPETGNPLLDTIREDHHYCYLIPLSLMTTYLFFFNNWLAMKFFRHA